MRSESIFTTKFSDEFLAICGMGLGLVFIIGMIVVALSIVMAVYYRRTQKDDMEATLKMEMLQRGMSAEEIERVLRAKMGTSDNQALANLVEAVANTRKAKQSAPPSAV
jgi:hypothetical protein